MEDKEIVDDKLLPITDVLTDTIRKELSTFGKALLVDVEKVLARSLSITMQGQPSGTPFLERSCTEFELTNPREPDINDGDLDVNVLAEADEEAADFVAELEAQAAPFGHTFNLLQDDSFASTFMAAVVDGDALHKPHYNVERNYHDTGIWQHTVRSKHFKNFMLLIVFANAVYIGIELDQEGNSQLYDSGWAFIISENLFCALFLFEIAARFGAFKHKRDCLRDGWFRFDLVLATFTVAEVWVIVPMTANNAAIKLPLAPIRLFRILKMTRMTRLLKSIPELMVMSKGMFLASRAVLSSMLMVCFLNYGFAVALQLLLSGDSVLNEVIHDEIKRDFSSIPACMWTLFMDGTQMAAGDVVLTELMVTQKFSHIFAAILMIFYMLLSSLVIMNMLIGCLCEVVSSVQIHEKEETAKNYMKQTILVDLQKFDNGDGMLTRKELHTALASPQSKQVLRSLQIDELFLKELQSMLFPHPDSQVSIQAVMQLMLSCRGDLAVTVLHLARGQAFISTLIASIEKKISDLVRRSRGTRYVGLAGANGRVGECSEEPSKVTCDSKDAFSL